MGYQFSPPNFFYSGDFGLSMRFNLIKIGNGGAVKTFNVIGEETRADFLFFHGGLPGTKQPSRTACGHILKCSLPDKAANDLFWMQFPVIIVDSSQNKWVYIIFIVKPYTFTFEMSMKMGVLKLRGP